MKCFLISKSKGLKQQFRYKILRKYNNCDYFQRNYLKKSIFLNILINPDSTTTLTQVVRSSKSIDAPWARSLFASLTVIPPDSALFRYSLRSLSGAVRT